jgi:hypothetical protein
VHNEESGKLDSSFHIPAFVKTKPLRKIGLSANGTTWFRRPFLIGYRTVR